jgi:hypothetical protein
VSKKGHAGLFVRRLTGFFALALSAALLLPAVAGAGYTLNGTSSQGKPVHFVASNTLMKITQFEIAWSAQCASGASYTETSSVAPMRVKPFPRFRSSLGYTATSPYSASPGRPFGFQVSVTVAGRLKFNGKGNGTWSAQVRVLDPAGQLVDTCNTGAVTWKASLD